MFARFHHLVSILLLAGVLSGMATAVRASSLEGIDLCWKPELDMDDLIKGMPDLPKVTVQVAPFRDTRFHSGLIGNARLTQTIEKKEKLQAGEDADEQQAGKQDNNYLAVTTEDNVAAWATEHFARSLHDAGLKVTDSDADVRITGEIQELMAIKGPDYNGDVAIRIAVEKGGEVIWRGTASGWARKADGDWDKGKAKRYCSILSDALLRAVASLVMYPRFGEALTGQISPATATSPAAPPATTPPSTPAGQ